MQQITLEGNLGRDPYFGQGTRTRSAHFSVATNPAKLGQRTPAPLWIPIVVFGDEPVRTVESRVRKGIRVRIRGILQTNPQRGGDRLVAQEIEVIARPRIVPTVRAATPEEMAPTPAIHGDPYAAGVLTQAPTQTSSLRSRQHIPHTGHMQHTGEV